jgi:hypothetical protein
VVDDNGIRKYEKLVTRNPRKGEKIAPGRILTKIEETKD